MTSQPIWVRAIAGIAVAAFLGAMIWSRFVRWAVRQYRHRWYRRE